MFSEIYKPTPPAFVWELVPENVYPGIAVLSGVFSFSFVSDMATISGGILNVKRISFKRFRFLGKLRVLQWKIDIPFLAAF